MERVERLVNTYMTSGRDEEVVSLVSDIASGESTLLQLVKALGDYLTSEDDAIRTKGMDLLSSVIVQSRPEKINSQAVKVLTTFFCDRLEDSAVLAPCIKGLSSLVMLPSVGDKETIQIVTALQKAVDMRIETQATRYSIFQLIDVFMKDHRSGLKAMGETFVGCWLKLASGEKDPRNLMLAFAIYRVILIEFPISKHLDALFENTFCYLPITFRPPPNDPYGITTDELVQALRSVISATPEFGPQALPLCLEKLTLGSPAIRRDILQTLSVTMPVYGPGIATKHAVELWKSIKVEIFQPTDLLTETDALNTVQVLVRTMYSDADLSATSEITGLAKDICSECNEILLEPDRSQAKPAIKILAGLVDAPAAVSRFVIQSSVYPLLQLFLDPEKISRRHAILVCLTALIAAVNKRDKSTGKDRESIDNTGFLEEYRDQLLGVATVGLKDDANRPAALACLSCLIDDRNFFSDEEIGYIVHCVGEATFSEEGKEDGAWLPSLNLLKKIGTFAPKALETTTLPLLFASIPDVPPPATDLTLRRRLQLSLQALEKLCVPAPLFEIMVIRFLAKVDLICGATYQDSQQTVEPTIESREERAAFAHSILLTLSKVLAVKIANKDPDVPKYVKQLLDRLYLLFINSMLHRDAGLFVATHFRILQTGANIAMLISKALEVEQQTSLFNSLYKAFVLGDTRATGLSHMAQETGVTFKPFESSDPTQRSAVILFLGPLVAMRPEVALPVAGMDVFVYANLIWAMTQSDSDAQSEAAHMAMASLLNKNADGLTDFTSRLAFEYWNKYIGNTSASKSRRLRGLSAWLWITKALLVRNHKSANAFVDKLFTVLDDDVIGWEAGRTIGLVGGTDDVLTKSNFAIIKILHTQKFANRVLPQIVSLATGSSPSRKAALVALTSLIRTVPRAVYQPELANLMPLLLRGLDLDDDTLRANVIDTLIETSQEASMATLVSDYATNLVTSMLKLSSETGKEKHSASSNVRVRVSALKYLGSIPEIVRYDILHPQKKLVIRSLGSLLDDPRRSVRTEAVETRSIWYTYNGSSD